MARRSVSLAGSSLCLVLLASLAQATLFGNFSIGLSSSLQKCSCQNLWSKIVTAFRNFLGLQQPPAAVIPTTAPPPVQSTPAPTAPANKSAVTEVPRKSGVQQQTNRYSDYNSWTYNFLGANDDFSDYDGSEDVKQQPTLPICHCDCGLANQGTAGNTGKVVGGTVTQKNEYPWLVRINYRDDFHCGASLINKDYIVTAAHCVAGRSKRRFRIILGDHNRLTAPPDAQVRKVSEVVRHRHYSERNMNCDIALIRLDRPVSFTHNIRPICQPPSNAMFANQTGTIVGWGTVSEGGSTSAVPLQAHLPIYSTAQCRRFKYRPSEIGNNMICAGGNNKDSCQGDSGGPLQVKNSKGKYELAGVVSWGNGCGREGYPGVYTEVAKYQTWIIDNMRDTCVCTS